MTAPDLPAASLATLQAWFDIAPDAMVAVGADGTIALANAQAEHMFGYGSGLLLGKPLDVLVPDSLRPAHRSHVRGYMAHPRKRPMGIGYELLGKRQDGGEFPVEIGLSPIANPQGIVAIASVRDISETRRVRQARERAHRDTFVMQIGRLALESPDYEVAIRRIPELVATALDVPAVAILSTDWHDSELRIRASTGLSRQAADMLATTFGKVRLIRNTFTPDGPEAMTTDALRDGPFASVHACLVAIGFADVAMVPLFGRDEPLGALVALAPTPSGFDHDKITFLQSVAILLAAAVQRSRNEEQLAHAQRLEAVGQLTGGIAHDFNNLLTIISGNLQLLEAELPEQPATRETIDGAMRAVDRGADLTRRLLAFARRQSLKPRAVVPQPLLEELGHMLRRTLGEAITVEVACAADVPDVYADPNELDTALVNLALNARDAMPRGGRLQIVAREVVQASADEERKLPAGRYVAFDIADNGTGMPPDVQAHAMEPFFTTKDSGKGSGLGLSMVYGFVTQSGGAMAIDSRLGYGTHVTIMLPVPNRQAATRAAAAVFPHDAAPETGHETILVVEDEADVRTIAVRFLTAVGYHVLGAASATEGMDILSARPDVDLLFSDVVLGSGMNGVELARAARQLRPGLAVLLASGYRGHGAERRDGAAEPFELLRKPYRREQLLEAIRHVLDAR